MIAAWVNVAAIIAGGAIGLLLRGGIPERVREAVIHALALAVLLIGLKAAVSADDVLAVILCVALGGIAGESLQLEQRFENFALRVEKRAGGAGTFAKGFVTATLVYCVGAMAVVGSLEAGLKGDYTTIFAKSAIDGVCAIIFASAMGVGVIFSAAPLLIYQGGITLLARWAEPILSAGAVSVMTSVGGLLIISIALSMLEIKKIRTLNLLPGLLLPPLVVPFMDYLRSLLS